MEPELHNDWRNKARCLISTYLKTFLLGANCIRNHKKPSYLLILVEIRRVLPFSMHIYDVGGILMSNNRLEHFHKSWCVHGVIKT